MGRELKNPFPHFGNGKGLKKKNIPIIRELEGNEKKAFPKFRNGKGMKKTIPEIREWEGNEKKAFPKFGNGKGIKKSIPIIRERESEAFILGNGREREFPLTPDLCYLINRCTFDMVLPSILSTQYWESLIFSPCIVIGEIYFIIFECAPCHFWMPS